MKTATLILGVIGAVMIVAGTYKMATRQRDNQIPTEVQTMWQSWKMHHNKGYGAAAEESYRMQVFYESFKKVNAKNSRGSATFELNKFADMTKEEFTKTYTGMTAPKITKTNVKSLKNLSTPDSTDWTNENVITPVKDQGQCGSCYAFSATGALEGLTAIRDGYLFYLSEQQIVDCARSFGNAGCSGGLMDHVFAYTASVNLEQEAKYPYTAIDTATCNSAAEKSGMKVNTGSSDVPSNDNVELMNAIYKQPVSVGVEADDWQFYKNGVFDNWDTCGTQLNHGVLAVGYGTDSASGKMFYKIKNSWGGSWGESGYIRLEKKDTNDEGMCGILKNASYPTM